MNEEEKDRLVRIVHAKGKLMIAEEILEDLINKISCDLKDGKLDEDGIIKEGEEVAERIMVAEEILEDEAKEIEIDFGGL